MIAKRRRRRSQFALAAGVVLAAVPPALTLGRKPPVLFVWNASASAPVGLYRLHHGKPVLRGDMVVAWTPEPSRTLAAERHYLPSNVPLVKRVAAVDGDHVCARGSAISVNGRRVAVRRRFDAAGRPMPWWNDCRLLRSAEFFLMMDSRWSFDGRYFGITRSSEIVGRAELLWAKPAKGSDDG